MRAPKFHTGQAVVCIDRHIPGPDDVPDIAFGTIYHVADPQMWWSTRHQCWEICLIERPCNSEEEVYTYDETHFAPVVEASDEALAELLEETLTLQRV